MGRRKKIKIDRNIPTYVTCEYTEPEKIRNTRHMVRMSVAWCELKCRHKCLHFTEVPTEEIERNIRLLIENCGEKYRDYLKSFDMNKKIYKKCVLCGRECKKEGIGILLSCENFKYSGRKKISKQLMEIANDALNERDSLEDMVQEVNQDKPKKERRGRPKGSKNKPKKEAKKNVKKQTSKQATTKKTRETKKVQRKTTKKVGAKTTRKPTKVKRGQKKTAQLVKGKIKSIRKSRGKNLYRLTLSDGQTFEPTGPRSPVNKSLIIAKELFGVDIKKCVAKVTMAGKKVKDIDIEQ